MKKRILTGLQPTGNIHIGVYLGTLLNWKKYLEEYDCYFFIADWHSMTIDLTPEKRNEYVKEMVIAILSLGVDPEKCTLFIQSDIREHTELAWYFNCVTPISFLERMTQFKDKAAKNVKNINMGLMDYPVLQAADILIYDADLVPVGADQVQHVELTRDIARFFNNRFGETFKETKPLLTDIPKVMSLTHPEEKMSKSDESAKSSIFLFDEPETIAEKIKKATTDKVGLENLYKLGEVFVPGFNRASYKDNNLKLKTELAEGISEYFAEFRKNRKEWLKKDKEIEKILKKGAEKARKVAQKKISEVRKKVGLR